MNTSSTKGSCCKNATNDEELIDTLIAISVVSKRLASKLKNEKVKKEVNQSEEKE